MSSSSSSSSCSSSGLTRPDMLLSGLWLSQSLSWVGVCGGGMATPLAVAVAAWLTHWSVKSGGGGWHREGTLVPELGWNNPGDSWGSGLDIEVSGGVGTLDLRGGGADSLVFGTQGFDQGDNLEFDQEGSQVSGQVHTQESGREDTPESGREDSPESGNQESGEECNLVSDRVRNQGFDLVGSQVFDEVGSQGSDQRDTGLGFGSVGTVLVSGMLGTGPESMGYRRLVSDHVEDSQVSALGADQEFGQGSQGSCLGRQECALVFDGGRQVFDQAPGLVSGHSHCDSGKEFLVSVDRLVSGTGQAGLVSLVLLAQE